MIILMNKATNKFTNCLKIHRRQIPLTPKSDHGCRVTGKLK